MQVKSARSQEQRRAHRSCTARGGAGCGLGPAATRAAPFPLGPLQAAGPNPLWCAALRAACGPPSFCALRVPSCAASLRGSAPARAACRRCAARVRLFAPSLRSPGPGRGHSPRLSRSARVRRCAAPWALAGPAALGSPSARCGLPPLRSGRPCSAPCSLLRFAGPRRDPPCPPAVASVALRLRCCAPSRLRSARLLLRLGGFGPGGFLPGGPARASPAFFRPCPPGFLLRAVRLRPACFLRRGFPSVLGASGSALLGLAWLWLCFALAGATVAAPRRAASLRVGGFAPASLPSLPPLRGLAGSARPPALGLPPRTFGPPLWSFLLPWGLTFGPFYGTLSVRGPFRSFGGCSERGIRGRQKSRLVI